MKRFLDGLLAFAAFVLCYAAASVLIANLARLFAKHL